MSYGPKLKSYLTYEDMINDTNAISENMDYSNPINLGKAVVSNTDETQRFTDKVPIFVKNMGTSDIYNLRVYPLAGITASGDDYINLIEVNVDSNGQPLLDNLPVYSDADPMNGQPKYWTKDGDIKEPLYITQKYDENIARSFVTAAKSSDWTPTSAAPYIDTEYYALPDSIHIYDASSNEVLTYSKDYMYDATNGPYIRITAESSMYDTQYTLTYDVSSQHFETPIEPGIDLVFGLNDGRVLWDTSSVINLGQTPLDAFANAVESSIVVYGSTQINEQQITSGGIAITNNGKSSLTGLVVSFGGTELVLDTDYSAALDIDGKIQITILDTVAIPDGSTLDISYYIPDEGNVKQIEQDYTVTQYDSTGVTTLTSSNTDMYFIYFNKFNPTKGKFMCVVAMASPPATAQSKYERIRLVWDYYEVRR